jgi:tRNA (guanine26-N2/guanine27-N2)-dimethyltransferase
MLMEVSFIMLDSKSNLIQVLEGSTKLWIIPQSGIVSQSKLGPGKTGSGVFFNPAMEFSRDLSILVIENFIKSRRLISNKKIRILDGLAGCGARGVRFGNEINDFDKSSMSILINDHNPISYDVIKKNILLNNLKDHSKIEASKSDLNALLVKNRFDYIDIDPFGSPMKFLDAGTRSLVDFGILAVTATDTATLFGTYPKTCMRRYDSYSFRTPFSHELGTRILIGACVRIGAKHNLSLTPILCHSTDYYYRIYLRGKVGRKYADDNLRNMGYITTSHGSNSYYMIPTLDLYTNPSLELVHVHPDKKSRPKLAGPLWLGPLYDLDFLKGLDLQSHTFGTEDQIRKNKALWLEEAAAPVGFYDANKLSSELKISTPPIPKLIRNLKDIGHFASRTHFNLNAFKTDADFSTICELMKNT